MKCVFLDLATYKQNLDHVHILENVHDDWVLHDGSAPEELVSRLQGAEICALNKVKMTREVFKGAPDLKLVIVGATGVDNVDLAAAKDHGVMVCNVVGYSTPAVAQYVFAGVLELMNSTAKYDALVKSGAWQTNQKFCLLDYDMIELSGKTLGLIGYGDIAMAVEKIALAFDMNVIRAERKSAGEIRTGRVAFDDVIKDADIISLHCPLTPDTRGMIGAEELSIMKNSAILVNTARGGIVDEAALAKALRERIIAGAVVDVVTQEPPRDGNPLLDPELENLIITPHCAWASVEARMRMFKQIAQILRSYKETGAPINRVI
ncbi:MAG: D-2-hydroxyacid dehydrogenase [Micavibrio sp.]|nr:D-2-hydroxyacid dehydrogenase [Micavibrio sp.]